MLFIFILLNIITATPLVLSTDSLCVQGCYIKYDRVDEKDQVLIENNMRVLVDNHIPKVEISPLSGGKSGDRLYLGKFETSKFVIRIMSEANSKKYLKQLSYSQMAAQNHLGPSVIHYNMEQGIFITEFIEGLPLLPYLLDDERVLIKLSSALHKIHDSKSYVQDKYDLYEFLEIEINNYIELGVGSQWVLDKYLDHIQVIKSAIKKRNLIPRPCHNDIHMSNVFYDLNQNIKFIDWGDAGLGDPFFDLARASIEFHLSKDQTEKFLAGYFSGTVSLVDRAHFALMEQLVLLKIGLYFLELPDLDEATKDLVVSYFKKNEIEIDRNSIHSGQDVTQIFFDLVDEKMLSDETKQALSRLNNLNP